MKLMGINPGLAACGIAIVDLGGAVPRVLSLHVARTEPSPKKRRLRSADDHALAAVVAGLESDVVRAALRARACPEQFSEGAA